MAEPAALPTVSSSSSLLYELPDYTRFDPSLALQDLRSRIAAARRAQSRYLSKRSRLSARIAKLSAESASVIRLLEARNSELSAAKGKWIESISQIPTIDTLEAVLLSLHARLVVRTASEGPASDVLDVAPFIAMGVLREGETLAVLPAKIDALLARRERNPPASGRALTPVRREIAIMKSLHKFEAIRTREEIERLRSEVIQTRKAVDA
jgi:hypothetical protein